MTATAEHRANKPVAEIWCCYDPAGGWHSVAERACHPLEAPQLARPSATPQSIRPYLKTIQPACSIAKRLIMRPASGSISHSMAATLANQARGGVQRVKVVRVAHYGDASVRVEGVARDARRDDFVAGIGHDRLPV